MPTELATWNPADAAAGLTLSNGNRDVAVATPSGSSSWRARGTQGKSTGQWYFEYSPVATSDTSGARHAVGVALSSAPLVGTSNRHADARLYLSSGQKANASASSYGASWDVGDVIGIALDVDAGEIEFFKNGVSQGVAFTDLAGGTWFPFVALFSDLQQTTTSNFGQASFAHTPPSGFEGGWNAVVLVTVERQWAAPAALRIAVERQWQALYGNTVVERLWVSPYALRSKVERAWAAPYALRIPAERGWSAPYSLRERISRGWVVSYSGARVSRAWRIPMTIEVARAFTAPYALRVRVQRQWAAGYSTTTAVSRQWAAPYGFLDHNPVARGWRGIYNLGAIPASVKTYALTATGPRGRLNPTRVELVTSEDEPVWIAALELGEVGEFLSLQDDDPVTVTVGGESYALIVDQLDLQRDGGSGARMSVRLLSPLAIHDQPRALPITREWRETVSARAVVEELLDQAVDWRVEDWQIAGGRLSVVDVSPLAVCRQIASAAGAVVRSEPNGNVIVQHRWPVAVPAIPAAAVDQVYTDATDALSMRRRPRRRRVFNEVTVRALPEDSGVLTAEVDRRADGLNRGATRFAPGTSAHLLVHKRRGLRVTQARSSAGALSIGPIVGYSEQEELVFDGGDTARLVRPAESLGSVVWLGVSLGALSLEADQVTVRAANPGVAIARVQVNYAADAWRLSAPLTVAGLDEFTIQSVFDAAGGGNGDIHIIAQRAGGGRPAPDVVDALIGSVAVARERGRQVIDDASDTQPVLLDTVFRAGVRTGQIIEVHDALQGAAWRGKITGVAHSVAGPVFTTRLEVQRA